MEKMLKITEVAKRLRVSRGSVLNSISDGSLPAQRMGEGKMWLIKESDLEALLARNSNRKMKQ